MPKYKVAVYAIAKNEEAFVDRWITSMSEADVIYVLDTGSTDQTVKKLKDKGAIVNTKIINPWRFDIARNLSLEMIDDDVDICVCTDLDEIFNEGWRQELERVWQDDTNRLRYIYNWSLDENNRPKVSFYYEKIHSNNNYRWIHPVHEILDCSLEKENYLTSDKIILNHYPDNTKSRSSYLPLLELSVQESPTNDRNMHYLGREYLYYGKYNEAIDTLIKHINLDSATWRDEKAASMRFIARSYINLNRFDEAKMWLDKAIKEAPYLRDGYLEKALLEYSLNNYVEVIKNCLEALKIDKCEKTYINEVFSWDETVYDLLSLSYYYENQLDKSIKYINLALEINPTNLRLLNNKKLFLEEKELNN